MTDELRGNLEALERHPEMDLHEQRTRIQILERATLYMSPEDHARFRAMCDRFRTMIMAPFLGKMGS